MEWYSAEDQAAIERIDAAWSDAPADNEELLGMLLDVARVQVLAFAEDGEPVEEVTCLLELLGYPTATIASVVALLGGDAPETPSRYVFAQLQQAKNLFNAGRIVGDSTGAEGFSFVPRPLSKEIQKIIRPQSGVASVL